MKITQIANALNKVIVKNEIGKNLESGDFASVANDLSNIVDIGKEVLNYTDASKENYDSFVRDLIDQVGKVIFVDRTYTSQAPNILKDGWEYGSVLQKVRCELQDARANATWDLFNYPVQDGAAYPDPFELSKPNVAAKFYNSKVTYEVPITLADYQLREAFRSASEMSRFIAMIENRIAMKRTLCNDGLIMQTIVNLIATKLNGGNSNAVINLLSLYGDNTLTATTALKDAGFLRFAAATIMKYKKYLAAASVLYNEGEYVTFTPSDRLKFITVADFAKDLETYLYSGTFHDEFVKLEGYEEVAFWQDAKNRMKIDTYISTDGEANEVTNSYVVAVLFDDEAAAVCNQNDRVTSIYNPRGEYTNFFYKWDALYMNDLLENCVVFTLSDEGLGDEIPASQVTIAGGADVASGKTSVTYTQVSGENAIYAKVDNKNLTTKLNKGETFTTTGWTSVTSGTAEAINATAGQYLNLVTLDSSSKVARKFAQKLTEDDIGTKT